MSEKPGSSVSTRANKLRRQIHVLALPRAFLRAARWFLSKLDESDAILVAELTIKGFAIGVAVLFGAFVFGLAIRIFEIARG